MNTTTITLKYPFALNGQNHAKFTMRRCKVKDRRMAMKQWSTDEDREIGLIANLCDVPPDVIEELDAVDYAQLTEMLKSFFGSHIPT